jgi:hypothetical protein
MYASEAKHRSDPSPVSRGGGNGWSLRSLEEAVPCDEQGVGVHVTGVRGGTVLPEIGPDQPNSPRLIRDIGSNPLELFLGEVLPYSSELEK